MTHPPTIRWSPPTGSPRISTIPRSRSSTRRSRCRACCRCRSDDYLARAYSGRGVFRCRRDRRTTTIRGRICIPTPSSSRATSAALGISTGDTVVAYDSGGWVAAPRAWWMFLSFGHRNVRVLDGGLKKWLARRPPDAFRQGHAEAGKIQGHARCGRIAQHAAADRQSRKPCRASGRCARRERFQGSVAEPRPGLPLRPYPRQPQRALRRIVRCRDRRDETAR